MTVKERLSNPTFDGLSRAERVLFGGGSISAIALLVLDLVGRV